MYSQYKWLYDKKGNYYKNFCKILKASSLWIFTKYLKMYDFARKMATEVISRFLTKIIIITPYHFTKTIANDTKKEHFSNFTFLTKNHMKILINNNNLLHHTRRTIWIEVWTKKYPLYITNTDYVDPTDGALIAVECDAAWIDQEYLASDLHILIDDLPTMIMEEQKHIASNRVNFRLSSEEKIQIEQNAQKYGFKTVSQFLKTLGKNPEKFLTQTH